MKVVVLVHVSQPLQGLKHNISNLVFTEEFLPFLHELVDIDVEVFKDEVEYVLVENDFVELNDVGVRQLHEGLDLSQTDALIPLVVLLLHLLYGHDLTYQTQGYSFSLRND